MMLGGRMKKNSLFTKFTILISASIVAGIIFTHFTALYFMKQMHQQLPVSENIYTICKILVEQIDINDKRATLSHIKQFNTELRYVNGNVEWTSSTLVPRLDVIKKYSKNKHSFWYNGDIVTTIETNNGIYIFMGINPLKKLEFPWQLVAVWSVFIIILLGFIHYKTREYLKPLKILHNGVLQAEQGDFSIKLPATTNDELGQLIHTFNSMALKVGNDIQSRDQLLRDLSHEFRSPLSRMMMATEFVPDVEIRQSLKNNILILEKMTASILEEERIDSPYGKINRDSFDLEKMLAEIVEQKKNNGQTVVLSTTESLILCADRERLRIAITNIVDNSLKYSRKDSGPVQIYYTKVDNAVQIRISDSGIGIAEAEIPFIFEPFYRVDKARKQTAGGYGLGLSLTKKIINAHNGTITVDSVISKGTTFTVSLPL